MTLPTPAANLAWEEALLEEREAHGGHGVLRFWESPVPFIVVGYAARVADEVHLDRCDALDIPILRRCSGGGTVLQGAGCLNYALVLPLSQIGPDATITDTNRFVMERHRATLETLLGQKVEVAGHTDLVLGQRKFSGNAQRRKRAWFLFHGTFLLPTFDRDLVEKLLRPPPREPEYRRHRNHLEFVCRLPVTSAALQAALQAAWQAGSVDPAEGQTPAIAAAIDALISSRYSRPEWNRR